MSTTAPAGLTAERTAGLIAALSAAVALLLDEAPRPAVVLSDLPLTGLEDATLVGLEDDVSAAPDADVRTVLLAVPDVAVLRRAVSRLGDLGRAAVVGVAVAETTTPLLVRAHPSWAPLVELDARVGHGVATTRLRFERRAEPARVLVALARSAAPVVSGPAGVWVAGDVTPPVDPLFVRSYDADAELPPDVLVVGGAGPDAEGRSGADSAIPGGLSSGLVESAVIGRAPSVVPAAADPVGPIDEGLFNPIGFRREWARGMVTLPPGTELSPYLVAWLRDAQGALVEADDPDDPVVQRLLAGLAMSAVPLAAHEDPDQRERYAVQARRQAMAAHSTWAWRDRLGDAAGVRHQPLPGAVATTLPPDADPRDLTDLLQARRWSGADLVVMPHDAEHPVAAPERYLDPAGPLPPAVLCHAADTSPTEVLATGGLVYLTRAAGRG